jgi:hypothetical protein
MLTEIFIAQLPPAFQLIALLFPPGSRFGAYLVV